MKKFLILLSLIFTLGCPVENNIGQSVPNNFYSSPKLQDDSAKELLILPQELKTITEQKGTINLEEFWQKLEIDDGKFFTDYNVNLSHFSLQNSLVKGAVLVLWNSHNEEVRLVLFRQRTNGDKYWKYDGYVDIPEQRYEPPKFRIVESEGKTWFVPTVMTGGGSGVSSYSDNWYEIKTGKLEPVLTYVSKGHEFHSNIWNRKFSGKVKSHSNEAVVIEFAVDWYGYTKSDLSKYEVMFSQAKKGVFLWNENLTQFVFSQKDSEITTEELENIYNFDTINAELYLKYTFQNLLQIAQNGNRKQKNWLTRSLEQMKDSQQTRELLDILNK